MQRLWIVEALAMLCCIWFAAWLRFHTTPEAHLDYVRELPLRALLIVASLTGAMFCFGLYQRHVRQGRFELILRLATAFVFGGVTLLVVYYALPQTYVGRGVLALSLVLSFCAVVVLRELHDGVVRNEALKQRVLVYGAGKNADLINRHMRRASDRSSFLVVAFVPVSGQPVIVESDRVIDPGTSGLLELVQSLNIDEIVMAADERRGAMPMEDMLACVQRGVIVTDLSSFFEREAGNVQLSIVDPSWLVFSGGFDCSTPRRISKRLFDLISATLLLLVTWPAMLAVALMVKLDSPGPALYRQVRVGEYGREFEIVKFRSMRCDAEKNGAQWASANDDRSTRFGKFIRKTRLDELPQLFMVLRGDMSFVGPRPERPQFVDMLANEIRYYDVRHSMKPGLTGWAQLRYPYGASVDDANEKLKYDLFYVKNHGLLFDLTILLQTVEVVMFGRGAR